VLHCALKEGVEGGRRGRQENGRRRRGGCRAGEVLEEGGGADMRAQAVGESREREGEGARPQAWWAVGSEKKAGGLQFGRVSWVEEPAGLRWGGGADRGELGRKRERRGVWVLYCFF
jgi:hypothetical protein